MEEDHEAKTARNNVQSHQYTLLRLSPNEKVQLKKEKKTPNGNVFGSFLLSS